MQWYLLPYSLLDLWVIDKTYIREVHSSEKAFYFKTFFGSGALSGKMLLVRIIENNKIDIYFRAG